MNIALLLGIAFPALLLYLGYRFVRALELQRVEQRTVRRLEDRLQEMEENIEALTGEVRRLEEGHNFTNKLLSERNERRGD
jgi:cell division protein FtsB